MTRHTDHSDRVETLIAQMTLEEKIAQLYGVWVGASDEGGDVAPHQHDLDDAVDLDALLPHGLGQLTRPFGTKPVDAALGALSLARTQERLRAASRFGIPAIAHEECLAGFAAWGATAYPVPLSWGATFDPDLVGQLGRRIGDDLRSVGVHQGLAPVLDVVRDARWGRVEETIGEDPHLVATIGAAYVSGVESAGVVATLKHFAGYSASKGGRNLAPVSIGPRELADVILPPFELAVRETGVRSVMNSYTDLDGVPTAADRSLLTGLLRETWGFEGTVVADYFSVAFLKLLHGVADTWADAAGQALAAGVDVELPTVKTFGEPLRRAVEEGIVDAALVDQSLRRVLRQKEQLGLLDPDWSVIPPALAGVDLSDPEALRGAIDLDPRENRALAARLAEEAIVLVRNDGTLPLARGVRRRIAVIGPNADDPYALLGCYSFPTHVVSQHPGVALGIRIPTLLEALREEYPDAVIEHVRGTSVDGGELDGIAEAVALSATADVVILALGDRAGLFGRGTSGEGCDAESLALPGAQQLLIDAVLDAGIPAVVVMLAGRPYALGRAVQEAAGIVEAFFAGEEGGAAIAGVLSGRVEPSGRLPVSIPRTSGSQPTTYLAAPLARATDVSNIDPSPAYPFGHGLSYAAFEWSDLVSETEEASTDGAFSLSLRIANTGARDGVEVVQLYLHDPVAEVPRPVQRLIGYARVALAAGEAADVRFQVPADLASYTGRALARIVEPGALVLSAGRSSGDLVSSVEVALTGSVRVVDHTRALVPTVEVALAARVVS
ncbi:glycoside hydrolase family 3 N-terminal domain-containing protein [Microbacterium sp. RU33B]|uniref:beta-xylosidase/alpha-l-arabinosidase n=1 Tax=Microbacterium sp. RU33B TaxID=1907390 RepID=UPI0009609A31|nr:glycoside hydrolase family 3 N-terminal domain-containing protein [Microbacterium sp. RU33B]SIT82711.1 beta-xylosidase [Microbacterium sp. RU33B]